MNHIFNLEYHEIRNFMISQGEPEYRADQIWQGLYQHNFSTWDHFSSLPKILREKLHNSFNIKSLKNVESISSQDLLTKKILFRLRDNHFIETVLIKKGARNTLCISTQIGCAVRCVFCATGKLGFVRNLSVGEIIEQIIYFSRILAGGDEMISNIVLMGMGEPLMNYKNVLAAIRKIISPLAMNFGARRITLSTIGITPMIDKLAEENLQINLAISLHTVDDDLRHRLIPFSVNYPIMGMFNACKNYFRKTGRRITFEYVLINGINDSLQQAKLLANLTKEMNCHINLIPLNPIPGYIGVAPISSKIHAFGRILLDNGIPVSIRDSQGSEIQAGCGQLAGKEMTA